MEVLVCRQWNDYRSIYVDENKLSGFHVSLISGGVNVPSPYPMLYAYMSCEDIPEGEDFAHSCKHGEGPHRIKVCITQKGNDKALYRKLRRLVEPDWGKRK